MLIDPTNSIYKINKIPNSEVFFPDYIQKYLNEYIAYLKMVKYSSHVVEKIEMFSHNIYLCLIECYYGQHKSAQAYFKEAVSSLQLSNFYRKVSADTFYRARKNQKSKLYQADGMFHICFEKRYLVGTQRYSYPGLPCLYLGSTVEVCCEELNCWEKNLNIARFKKNTPDDIYVFDLYFFENYDFSALSDEEENIFVELWPLVACCSFSYQNTRNMTFRPDYIIPQLLLELIIDQNAEEQFHGSDTTVYGIRYHSVRKPLLNHISVQEKNKYINYVFPAMSCESTGFCQKLQSLFEVDEIFKLKHFNRNTKNRPFPLSRIRFFTDVHTKKFGGTISLPSFGMHKK